MTGTVEFFDHIIRQFVLIAEGILQVGIQRTTVGAGDRSHIVERLGPSFDFKRIHTCLADQIQERSRAQIIGVEDITAVFAFANFHILSRAAFLHQGVLPATGLCAFSAVSAAPRHVTGQQAASRHTHAHGPMYKGFQIKFRRTIVTNLGNLGQRQFPGQNHALGAQFIGHPGGLVVGDACLCGDVPFHPRRILFGQSQHTQIGNNKSIHPRLGGILNVPGQFFQFLVGGQRIKRQINLFAPGMGKNTSLLQFFHGQVDRCRPHAEFRQSAVHRISAVQDCILQRFQAAGRRQKFGLLQHDVVLL